MKLLINYLAVAAGGSLGAVARYAISSACLRLLGVSGFAVGTFIINITGSFILGYFIATTMSRPCISDATRLAVATGFVGAYTTFSTYMYESDVFLRDGAWLKATLNITGSIALGLIAVRLGMWMGTP